VVDTAGNAYVTGIISSGVNYEYGTVKYDTSGYQLWANIYDSGDNIFDYARCLALDGSGNPIVAGGSYISGNIIKYNPSGTQLLRIAVLPDPEMMISQLIAYVSFISTKNSAGLTALLESALKAYSTANNNNINGSINKMNAFINACNAGSLLNWEVHETLVDQANRIIKVLQLIRISIY